MSIFKKKLLTVIALLCACICFTVLGFSLTAKPEQASADGSGATQDNVAITRYNVGDYLQTFWAHNSTSGGSYASINNQLNTNTWASNKSKADDPEHSYSDYNGNYTITSTSAIASDHMHGILFRDNVDFGNALVTFRTKYLNGDIYLRGMTKYTNYARISSGGGYYFILSSTGYSLYRGICGGNISRVEMLAEVRYADNAVLGFDDNLIVTFGTDALSYTAGNGTNYSRTYVSDYYLKVVRVNDDYTTTVLADRGVSDSENRIQSNTQVAVYGSDFEALGMSLCSFSQTPVFMGGISRPIAVAKPSAAEITVGGTVGAAVSTISLPNGYAFNDKTATIASGTNTHVGKQATYYEQTSDVNISVMGLTQADQIDADTENPKLVGEDGVQSFWGFGTASGFADGDKFNKDYNNLWVSDLSMTEVEEQDNYDGISYSEYSGNYTVTTASTVATGNEHGVVFRYSADYSNSIASFRTKYLGGDIFLTGMSFYNEALRANGRGGFYFTISKDGYSLSAAATTNAEYGDIILAKTPYDNSVVLSDNDNLIVTYGCDKKAYIDGDKSSIDQQCICDYYLKVEKVNADGTTITLVDHMDENKIVSNVLLTVKYKNTSIANTVVCEVRTPLIFGGVNRPIAMENVDLSITTDIVGLEDELVTTKSSELPSGYSFRTPTDKFVYGKVSYTGSADYYNVKRNITINIASVTPTRRSITFVDNVLPGVKVAKDGTYTFEQATGIMNKVFIGWLDGEGNLYGVGDSIAYADIPESGLNVKRVDIGFSLEVGAAVRYAVDEDNKGGIRFIVDINAADLDTYDAYINGFKSAIVPTDMLSGDISSHIKALDINAGLIEEKDGVKRVSFALTDILYSNFNREFSGLAYISVTTVGGEKLIATNYNEEDNSRSIYEVALKLLDDHYIELNDGDEIDGTRTAKELEVLGNYVKQTVDIVVEEDVDNHTLSISKDEGQNNGYQNIDYVEYAPYTVADEVVYNNDDSYTVTLTVTFSGDVDKDFIKKSGDDWQIPVTVRVYDQVQNKTVVYRLCGEGAVTLAQEINYNETDGVATIKFIFRPVR